MEKIEVSFLGIEGFTVPTHRHCRTSPVVAYKDQNISACEERTRNDVNYRQIRSLTFTSIYGIYFAWGFLMTSEKSKNVLVRKRASSTRVLVEYDLQANLGPWIWFTSESRQEGPSVMISLISLTVLVLHAKESDEPLRFLALSHRLHEKNSKQHINNRPDVTAINFLI